MVLRKDGWRVFASAAACVLAAGALSTAFADDLDPIATGGVPKMVWGGPLPEAPRPGEVPVYVPSRSIVPSRPQPQTYAPIAEPEAPGLDETFAPQATIPPATEPAANEPADALYQPQDMAAPQPAEAEPRQADLPPAPDPLPPIDGESEGVPLYTPIDADPAAGDGAPLESGEGREAVDESDALPPLGAPVDVSVDPSFGTGEPRADPWAGLKDVTPGPASTPRKARASQSFASLETPRRSGGSILDEGRGALEDDTPTGYQTMPRGEVMCRRALSQLGVKFVDATSISRGRSCGIDYPVKVTGIVPGVAMQPAATLNCMATLRVAQWMKNEVMPAARWKLLERPTALVNASSYRCSRIAGSRSISEHATGNALDVHGFRFADGSVMEIEKKGFFQFRQKAFQKTVRESACRYFGTVLGPGYNEDHADHLHLDAKQRRRVVCK